MWLRTVRLLSRNFSLGSNRLFCAKSGKTGEWLADAQPDVSFSASHRQQLIESLVKRIRVMDHAEAEKVVNELEKDFQTYRATQDNWAKLTNQFNSINKRKKTEGRTDVMSDNKLSKLDFLDFKAAIKRAKREQDEAYNRLLVSFDNIPNIVDDIELNTDRCKTVSPASIQVPSLLFTNDEIQYQHAETYLTGQRALLERSLTDFAAEYLEKCRFTPVTIPSFLRHEVAKQCGMAVGRDSDVYALMTKPELHAAGIMPRKIEENRKAKVEDSFVYQLRGLSEASFIAFFLRSNFNKVLPMKLSSVGTQYQMPHTGKPSQSRVAMFLTASTTKAKAQRSFIFGVSLVENFWKLLGVDVSRRVVDAHLLAQHEASAVEYVMNRGQDGGQEVVLSRVAISYDFVSRRMMAYSQFSRKGDSAFCHFTTGELINIKMLMSAI